MDPEVASHGKETRFHPQRVSLVETAHFHLQIQLMQWLSQGFRKGGAGLCT